MSLNSIAFIICLIFHSQLLAGRPSSHSIKHARWLVVTTTSQAACSSPGSATIKAGSTPTRHASTSGTPCRMCSHIVLIRPFSSLMRKYPDHIEYASSPVLNICSRSVVLKLWGRPAGGYRATVGGAWMTRGKIRNETKDLCRENEQLGFADDIMLTFISTQFNKDPPTPYLSVHIAPLNDFSICHGVCSQQYFIY